MWAKAARRPVDTFAILGAGVASLVIVVNAVFLQSGSPRAPFFANPAPRPTIAGTAGATTSRPAAATAGTHSPTLAHAPQTASARTNDPIGQLIGSLIVTPARVTAVQRALSEFGYGQIKPSGILDRPTSAAIEKFEREHKLPVTGRLSDRLMSDLAAMTGHPLE